MAWSRAFQKCIICDFLDKFFCKHFYYITGFCDKNSIFANLQIFLQILKVEHKSLLMMYHLSYLDIKHGIQRGGKIDPPPSISWFSSTTAGIGLTPYLSILTRPNLQKYGYCVWVNSHINAYSKYKCLSILRCFIFSVIKCMMYLSSPEF